MNGGVRMKRICLAVFISIMAFFAFSSKVHAEPEVFAYTYILMESSTGRIIAEQDMHNRMFPAATTMILTAILAYEYLGMDEIFIVSDEVNQVPFGAATIGLEVNEAILGLNLIRGMLIGAGLDAANVVALNVARAALGEPALPWLQAQAHFIGMMNARALELGALDSRFVNAHGMHHGSHFTSAYDLARIARHFIAVPTLAQIAATPSFTGAMAGTMDAGELELTGVILRNRTFNSSNELIRAGENFYSYARGIRAGRTDLAGDVLVAAAEQGGVMLISVTMNSPHIDGVPTRWRDNIQLFEYGFGNYAHEALLFGHAVQGRLDVLDPRLGDEVYLEYYSIAYASFYMSQAELLRVEIVFEYSSEFVGYYEDVRHFLAPIYEGTVIGTISHILDGEVLFVSNLYAARDVYERTTSTDIEYWLGVVFSRAALPYWVAGVLGILLVIVIVFIIRKKFRDSKSRQSKYKIRL